MTATYSIYEDNDYRIGLQPPSFFRSPASAASSVSLGYDSPYNGARKRSRGDYFDRSRASPYGSANPQWPNPFAPPQSSFASPQLSPAPLTNTQYRLADGLDTPGEAAASLNLDPGNDVDWRSRWTNTPSRQPWSTAPDAMGPLDREHNGRKRTRNPVDEPLAETWGQYVFRVAGGFARGAWDFCKDTAFRGFKAGGGVGYDMTDAGVHPSEMSQSWCNVDPQNPSQNNGPGNHSQEDFYDAAEAFDNDRPAKRLHVDTGDEWVFVDPSSSSRPSLGPRQRRPAASRLSSASRRTRPSLARLSTVSHAGSPLSAAAAAAAPDRTRSASFASARSPHHGSPLQHAHARSMSGTEAQRWSAKRQKEDRQADASMRRLNQQLKAMIREGKEALATRVEIEEHDGSPAGGGHFGMDEFKDEGFADGDWNDGLFYTKR